MRATSNKHRPPTLSAQAGRGSAMRLWRMPYKK
jgi:hypothetical protein